MAKPPKPPKNTGPLEPQVDVRDVTRQGIRQAIKHIPGVGDILEVLEAAAKESRERRKAQWAAYVAAGTDGSGAADVVKSALSTADGDVVRTALLEGARAAVDAVDDAVIPSIGLLTRRRLQTGTPDLRRYREILSLLRTLDAEEFAALNIAVAAVVTMLKTTPHLGPYDVRTFLYFEQKKPGDGGRWKWTAAIPYQAGYLSKHQRYPLLEGPMAFRIGTLLRGSDRLLFEERARKPEGPLFTRAMIELFESIMPS